MYHLQDGDFHVVRVSFNESLHDGLLSFIEEGDLYRLVATRMGNRVVQAKPETWVKGKGYAQKTMELILLAGIVEEWRTSSRLSPTAIDMYVRMKEAAKAGQDNLDCGINGFQLVVGFPPSQVGHDHVQNHQIDFTAPGLVYGNGIPA